MTTNYCIRRHIVRQVNLRKDNRIVADEDTRFISTGVNHIITDFYLNRSGIVPQAAVIVTVPKEQCVIKTGDVS